MNNICTVPVYELKELNNLFIELTAKNCNQRCQSCYIKFPMCKSVKDFISIDRIKEAIEDTKSENLYCIYLTGAEPMTHPDFNAILRLCLRRCNVCICTNGSFLNEKKIRFLKKVEDEVINTTANQIFFKLSLTHFNELESDKTKYRGNYRQTLFVLKTLAGYNFDSVLTIQNIYNLDEKSIRKNFEEIFKKNKITNTDLQIICSYSEKGGSDVISQSKKSDCMYGRTLGAKGVFACPFLSNDYRGRVGSSFKNYSKTFRAETDFCMTCAKNNDYIFSIG